MAICEACWAEARSRHLLDDEGWSVVEIYNKLFDERHKCPHTDTEPQEPKEENDGNPSDSEEAPVGERLADDFP